MIDGKLGDARELDNFTESGKMETQDPSLLYQYQDKKKLFVQNSLRGQGAVLPNYLGRTEKNNSGFIVKNNHQFFISDILCYES